MTAGGAESADSLSNIPPYRDVKSGSWAATEFFTAGVFVGYWGWRIYRKGLLG